MQKAELGSTLRNMLPQLATSKFVAWQVGSAGGNTGNNAFQLAMQQCCALSWAKMLLVFLESASEQDEANPHSDWLPDSPAPNFPRWSRFSAYNISFIFQACSVKMDECCLGIFFNLVPRALFLWTRLFFCVCFDWPRQKELRNIQPSWHHVWPITHIH